MSQNPQIINNSVVTSTFSKTYPLINKYLMENGTSVGSRNGETKEVLDFKTQLDNPYYRCVGGYKRDINIFFLIAEAMWIFTGKKDTNFLNIFNKKMINYSDDKKSFNAPYGFRIRNWGVNSFDVFTEENKHASQGLDQLEQVVAMLDKNPLDRRAVMSIWNPDYDLNRDSLDIPCNDLVMFKIRNNKLHTTISNRSNDLHWGLTTNVFQFGFLSEIISNVLSIKLGTQVHNSQSLHAYLDNEITWKMYEEMQLSNSNTDLYDHCTPFIMDFNFKTDKAVTKLREVDYWINLIISDITLQNQNLETHLNKSFVKDLKQFSSYLYNCYRLLSVYNWYQFSDKSDHEKMLCLQEIDELCEITKRGNVKDYFLLAFNFFISKIKDQQRVNILLESKPYLGKL